MNQIRQCRFMICDLSYARPSVYFEAGFAFGRGVKIIYTCNGDHDSDHEKYNPKKNKVHFGYKKQKNKFLGNG